MITGSFQEVPKDIWIFARAYIPDTAFVSKEDKICPPSSRKQAKVEWQLSIFHEKRERKGDEGGTVHLFPGIICRHEQVFQPNCYQSKKMKAVRFTNPVGNHEHLLDKNILDKNILRIVKISRTQPNNITNRITTEEK